jgi:hypothetical protein
VTAIAIRACSVLLVALGFWCTCSSRGAIAWPNSDSYSPVAKIRSEYKDPSTLQRAVRAIEDVAVANNFNLNHPPVRLGLIHLNYLREVDGVEIMIDAIGKPTVLEVYIYDRLRKGTWQEMKDKVEAEMNRVQ